MQERIRRCTYCQSVMKVNAAQHSQNPFCIACLDERLKLSGAREHEEISMEGEYVALRPVQDITVISKEHLAELRQQVETHALPGVWFELVGATSPDEPTED